MHANFAWLIPLAVAGVGAGSLAALSVVIRRDVTELQKAMRPLRVSARRSDPRK